MYRESDVEGRVSSRMSPGRFETTLSASFITIKGLLELNPAFRDYNERTEKVEHVLKELRDKDVFVTLRGWRDEYYEVKDVGNNCLLKMDRSATPLFGIRNYGVTINGFVRHPDKGLCMWLQQRSNTKQTWPGFWDNL